ncbi:MAG: ATP/GTP-binding protein [Desulfotomaculum sp. 46_296]|nr:MAG: ATP/GTP-binding protein [Desulfotomaculum sp. 46_296]
MINEQKLNSLKSFAIYGLFGSMDIVIPFDSNVNILIGENGLGKTTMLNALYYTLKCKFEKLNSIVFDRIVLEFHSGKCVDFNKNDIIFYSEADHPYRLDNRIYDYVNHLIEDSEKREIYNLLEKDRELALKKISSISTNLTSRIHYSPGAIRHVVKSIFLGSLGKIDEIKTTIKNEINSEVLYFPTYRRIEEELSNLGAGKIELAKDDKRLIQFGMEDVEATFKNIILSIKDSAIEGFSEITGEMQSQYVDGLHEIDAEMKDKIKPDILNITRNLRKPLENRLNPLIYKEHEELNFSPKR